ncbi:MAG: aldo/keto reductase, partial [Anaerolineae bacterium]|nr:aldo/keto reductase [Anaerolineae bacterium]
MKRTLGRSTLEVSALGMGCWALGGPWRFLEGPGGWGEVDDAESVRAIHTAIDEGITFFDTAANYGAGHSERILAQALAGKRQQVIIATKFGYSVDEAAKQVWEHDGPAEQYVRDECEASLRRLNTDVIDLYQFHVNGYPPAKASPVREALEDLVRAGKIRFYGWSTDSVEGARVFAEGEHCVAIQHDLNAIFDAPEMIAFCERANLASVNRSPLVRGALTGKHRSASEFGADDVRQVGWSRGPYDKAAASLDAVRDVLTSEGRTPAQGALAWIWAR